MSAKLQVRVISPWFDELETEEAFFSVQLPAEKADALLCDWAPSDELLTFPRRKAWYCTEPWCQFQSEGGRPWMALRRRLAQHEFLCHNHPDERWRVPAITHVEPLTVNQRTDRKERAVAIVSNYGGDPGHRHRELTYRNRFVTQPLVDLFGRSGWKRYRAGWFSRRATPPNYQGELPGDWPAVAKREMMASYKVAVCLENMREPFYFTEKFVEAVCAGCIPVYRAHATVAPTVLRGAAWVDPAQYGDDPQKTLRAALALDPVVIRNQNEQWLASPLVACTHHAAVFARIGRLLRESILPVNDLRGK